MNPSGAIVADGRVFLTADQCLLQERGGKIEVVARGDLGGDMGPSPNLGPTGTIYCGGYEQATGWDGDNLMVLDESGYDICTPALYADGTVALAAYRGMGLCRRTPQGHLLWVAHTTIRDQDSLVTLQSNDFAACGSVNDRCSLVVDPQGKVAWTFCRPACFSCYPDGGWIARSHGALTRLTPVGEILWTRSVQGQPDWGLGQAVVDSLGRVYVPCDTGLPPLSQLATGPLSQPRV